MNQTFGSFVRQKRMEQGLSLRGLAARLDLSPVYMSNIETGRKPAPARENLDKLTLRVSADLPEYIMERDIVRAALRTAKEVDATDEEWQEFIDRITKRTPSSRRDGP